MLAAPFDLLLAIGQKMYGRQAEVGSPWYRLAVQIDFQTARFLVQPASSFRKVGLFPCPAAELKLQAERQEQPWDAEGEGSLIGRALAFAPLLQPLCQMTFAQPSSRSAFKSSGATEGALGPVAPPRSHPAGPSKPISCKDAWAWRATSRIVHTTAMLWHGKHPPQIATGPDVEMAAGTLKFRALRNMDSYAVPLLQESETATVHT